jgi:hypothetical protein
VFQQKYQRRRRRRRRAEREILEGERGRIKREDLDASQTIC